MSDNDRTPEDDRDDAILYAKELEETFTRCAEFLAGYGFEQTESIYDQVVKAGNRIEVLEAALRKIAEREWPNGELLKFAREALAGRGSN